MDDQLSLCELRSCLRLCAVIEQNRLAQQEQALVLSSGEPTIRMTKSILAQSLSSG